MTVQYLINKICFLMNDRDKQMFTDAELLFLINMGRRKLASSLFLFSRWESINITQGVSDYTLSKECLQLIQAVDSTGADRPINNGDAGDMGKQDLNKPYVEDTIVPTVILRISPTILRVQDPTYNNPDDTLYIDFNYYYIPDDLGIDDEIDLIGTQTDILITYCRMAISERPMVGTSEIDVNARDYWAKQYTDSLISYQLLNPTNRYKTVFVNKIASGGFV
jgi:hypothetical protein